MHSLVSKTGTRGWAALYTGSENSCFPVKPFKSNSLFFFFFPSWITRVKHKWSGTAREYVQTVWLWNIRNPDQTPACKSGEIKFRKVNKELNDLWDFLSPHSSTIESWNPRTDSTRGSALISELYDEINFTLIYYNYQSTVMLDNVQSI